ncbi:mitochondrial E3 ubiquitin protein ligase 1-like [Schistocerca cancellata]|uniref:mitochondrial E3 ubiquitin protein ligase 1-like n=1 Tax=Schistocerca cancellata TaxID=274614 RepID=UPI0021190844|nr:mitochondrial E3 ubiquitin protein ligase 1-like [Schistocerca cancellata]
MEYSWHVIGLGIDALVFGICLKQYIKGRRATKALQDVSVHEIDPSLEDLVHSLPDHKVPYIAVRGVVKALGKSIKSLNSPDTSGVVQKLSIKEHVVSRTSGGFWSDHERTIQEVYNTVPFVLLKGSTQIEVIDALDAEILDLETISDHFEPSTSSIAEHLWGFFTGVRRRGLQISEEMLREGVLVTGIGELSSDNSETGLKLQPPEDGNPFFITALPISSLIRRIEYHRRTYRILSVVFGIIGLAIVGHFTYRLLKQRARRLQEEELHRKLEEMRRERRQQMRDANVPEGQECIVCRTNPREIILLPCGHVCLCETCGQNIHNTCPVCRNHFERKAPVYLS